MTHSSTVQESIEQVIDRMSDAPLYFGHGTDNVEDEAAWLVLGAIGVPLDGSFDDWDKVLSSIQQDRIAEILEQRVGGGVPLAYALGRAVFANLEFEVNEHVLVPRSPIAELIVEQFSPWLNESNSRRALDLCTGCGCIAIAMARYLPWLMIDASDISSEALEIAQKNVTRHDVQSTVRLIKSDLFEQLGDNRYDVIVTNPPYIPEGSIEQLPLEYRAEPRLGLISGNQGLDAVLEILMKSPQFLSEKGLLICEVGESESRLVDALPGLSFLWLEFSEGGSGVFLISREDLLKGEAEVAAAVEERTDV